MNPTAQAALDRARHPTPAPVFSIATAPKPDKPLPMPVPTGVINQFMRMRAREDARDMVRAHRAKLNDTNGVAQVIEVLKRAATGRPGSVVQGFLDVIEWLRENGQ
ncbi:hypothetical protein N7613_01000 [Pseudomonas juntendi]|uniref:hypothetical protein n=1 Tax=Pseudomonas TaxID=286 RepID=UPI0018E6D9AB|nr:MULTISPECIES: hypothetical protein [Pseudomonas]MBI6912454.1 hypothetical protein [Pseudomonas juntendi]MDG9807208.1 hypothetical protein [Pseudomonas juntendi]